MGIREVETVKVAAFALDRAVEDIGVPPMRTPEEVEQVFRTAYAQDLFARGNALDKLAEEVANLRKRAVFWHRVAQRAEGETERFARRTAGLQRQSHRAVGKAMQRAGILAEKLGVANGRLKALRAHWLVRLALWFIS